MDPCEQPNVLQLLTQVEDMLIAHVNPILQVTHAHCGQYKYSGHTISFPQDITTITKYFPHKIKYLDLIIVLRTNRHGKHYDFYVSRSHVQNVLAYKIQYDPY